MFRCEMAHIFVIFLYLVFFIPQYSYSDFLLGVNTHIADKSQNIGANIDIVKAIGASSLRDEFKWGDVEKIKGEFSAPFLQYEYLTKAVESQLAPLVILDYGNLLYEKGGKPVARDSIRAFANYARFTSGLLRNKIYYYEIWNEWFPHREPTSVESYYNLLKEVAPAIKTANKDAIVFTGGVTVFGGWVENLVKRGALNYVDGIGLHPYIHCDNDNRPEVIYNYLKDLSSNLNKINGGKSVPLYITETGWPSYEGKCGIKPEIVAQYLVRELLLVRTIPDVKGFWWYDIKNDGIDIKDMEHNFGLLDFNYHPKPAFAAFKDVASFVINARSLIRIAAPTGIIIIEINGASGGKSFAFWSSINKKTYARVHIIRDESLTPLLLRIGTQNFIQPSINTSKSNELIFDFDGMPTILTGIRNLSEINIDDWRVE